MNTRRMRNMLVVLMLGYWCAGCGTILMRRDRIDKGIPIDSRVYPATTFDLMCIAECSHAVVDRGHTHMPLDHALFGVIVGVIDLPVSLVVDTVMLPWDLASSPREEQTETASPPHTHTD